MAETTEHCPFVNRSDERCASHLTMGHLSLAFDHCFDRFVECPVYAQLRREQMALEAVAEAERVRLEELAAIAAPAGVGVEVIAPPVVKKRFAVIRPLLQLRLPRRQGKVG